METESEKVTKDTLNQMLYDDDLLFFQKVCTPRYQAEPIDFLAVTPDGRSHLIEVKENNGHSVQTSQFKDHQQEYLTRSELQLSSDTEQNHTYAWIITRFYRDDVQKNHTNYFEHYFLAPGRYASKEIKCSVNSMRSAEDCIYLGGWKHGGWTTGISETYGRTTKGNNTLGFDDGIPLG